MSDSNSSSPTFDESLVLHHLKHYLPSQAALKDFVHHNPLHAFQSETFFDAVFRASDLFGFKPTFNLNEFRKLHQFGRIREEIIDRVIIESKGSAALGDWKEKLLSKDYQHSLDPKIGRLRAEWKRNWHFDLDDRVQPLLFRILASYLDQGIALKHFPFEDKGLIPAIKTLEENSFVSFFQSKRARALLFSDSLSLKTALKEVVGKEDYFAQYIYDQQFGHKGWSGIINAIEDAPGTLLYPKMICLRDFIILELLLELDALEIETRGRWRPLSEDLGAAPVDYFEESSTDRSEFTEVLQLWQEAFEWDYYDEVLSGVKHLATRTKEKQKVSQSSFQALFCVDDRECSIRRHIEHVDPKSETFGAPGFYGVSIYFQPFGGQFYEKNCPVVITPKHLIREVSGSTDRGNEIFHHKHSHTFWRGFLYTLSLGGLACFRLVKDLFQPSMRPDIADAFAHMDVNGELHIECSDPSETENGLQLGFRVSEMVPIVESLLHGIGLTENFAEIVYVIAHGSSSANNPHHGAHDCGACSGRPGAPNARVFACMANHPAVRASLRANGLEIPESTQFLAAMHDTASDEIAYYDLDALTEKNRRQHEQNLVAIETALDLNAKERARRFASIDIKQDIKKIRKAIKKRSVSYFEPRPELGHGSNALCYVGSRDSIKGLFLDRRAFLQSYDHRTDPDGERLKQVLGPLPGVCGGINLEYYFSRVDNEKMGAGTKLPHNVTGLIAVTNSTDGDLRPGLPWQMVENHDPVRLLMIVEHRPEVVLDVLRSSPDNLEWFAKGWLHLVAVSPEDRQIYTFHEGEFHPYTPLTDVQISDDILSTIASTQRMATNHILDSTRENIPAQVYRR